MVSDRQLKHWYDKYNAKWFGGELPSHTALLWEPLVQADGETCNVYEVDHGQFMIKLDPSTKGFPKMWKLTLFHELCHLALWPKHPKSQHGKPFQQEMQRLANAGAFRNLW